MSKPDPAPFIFAIAANPSNPALANPAVAHCCEVWQRAARLLVAADEAEIRIVRYAGAAYRSAMPPLAGPGSVSDFVACVTYGMSLGVIDPKEASKFLYAAQVAAAAFRNPTKPSKPPPDPPPPR
ncbi:MAG: hypothetical protein ACLQG3_09640 [Terracidiphilus sp.]